MVNEVVVAVSILTFLGLLFATILAIAYKKLKVYEDPRIDKVESMLPNANCGACGEPGCRAFAEKVVAGDLQVAKCTVSSPEGITNISNYLGVDAGESQKLVARLLCAGGKEEAHNKAQYKGNLSTCRGEAVVAGGPKDCSWGCIGLGDCVTACSFGAITLNSDGLPKVDPAKCTACGDCVEICPKNLFVLLPIENQLIVQCKSLLEGDEALERCSVACNGCSRCMADAAPKLITMQNGLAVINYEFADLAHPKATRRCPTGAITWLDNYKQFEKSKPETLELGRVGTYEYDSENYYQ